MDLLLLIPCSMIKKGKKTQKEYGDNRFLPDRNDINRGPLYYKSQAIARNRMENRDHSEMVIGPSLSLINSPGQCFALREHSHKQTVIHKGLVEIHAAAPSPRAGRT